MKKVLIITYYWPPAGGSGVQRWLKFVKYLREFGWEPTVYTALNGEYPLTDPTLESEVPDSVRVIREPIWEPFDLYRRFTGSKGKVNVGFAGTERKSFLSRVAIWIRGNVFIPDSRKYWIKPSVKTLRKVLSEENFDMMITTGPPHSMHLIGLGLKKEFDLTWVADFRDPWSRIDYAADLNLSSYAMKKHVRLERKVLEAVDAVIAVSEGHKQELLDLGARKAITITNGYDDSDFDVVPNADSKKFIISHVGVMPASRNPDSLWKVLKKLSDSDQEFKSRLQVRLVGKVDPAIIESIMNEGLSESLEKIDHVDHSRAIQFMLGSTINLLVINRSENASTIIPGKVFEYFGAKRPILVIGPGESDSAKLIAESGVGTLCDYNDESAMEKVIREWYKAHMQGGLELNEKDIERYSRFNLTRDLADYLYSLD